MTFRTLAAAFAVALALAAPAAAAPFQTLSGEAPIVIAHRGASGYLPEHTLGAYELGIRMGADFIEPDLQLTSDGHLVAMHDATLARTTDVATLFPGRENDPVSSFTLAEIRTLTVIPTGTAATSYPGFTPGMAEPFRVPTFVEVLAFLTAYNAANGTDVGVYPEAKTPNRAEMNRKIVEELKAAGFTAPEDKVFIQSFSYDALKDIDLQQADLGTDLRTVALGAAVKAGDVFGMFEFGANVFVPLDVLATHVEGLGTFIGTFSLPGLGGNALSSEFIAAAHGLGLEVHGWTFRPTDLDAARALTQPFIDMGMDGFFTDYPDLTLAVIEENIAPIPVPAGALLLLTALGGVAFLRRRV